MIRIKNKNMVLIPILAMAVMIPVSMGISPILADLGADFPNASDTQIQLVFTTTSLAGVVSILLSGVLAGKVSNRAVGLAGLILICAGGIVPVAFQGSLFMLYAASSLIGMGSGFANVISSTLVSEYFTGIKKGTVMGFHSTAVSLGGILLSFGSSQLSGHMNWMYGFFIYLLGVPVFILVFILLPKDKDKDTILAQDVEITSGDSLSETGNPGANSIKPGMTWQAWYFVIMAGLTNIFSNAFSSNIAMFLDSTGMGDVTVAGYANSLFMLVGIPAGLSLGLFIKLLKRNVVWIMTFLIAVGMVIVAFSPNIIMVYVGTLFIGIGYAIRNPASTAFLTGMVSEETSGFAISMTLSVCSLGMFCTPVVVNTLAGLIGGGDNAPFLVSAAGLTVISALYFFINPVRQESVS